MQNKTTKPTAIRELWSSGLGIDATDPNDITLIALGGPESAAKNAAFSALAWAKARGHEGSMTDKDETLLFSVHPFVESGGVYRTRAVLASVPRNGTLAYMQREIGGNIDCRETDSGRGPLDVWMADDYGDVCGINPLLSVWSGFRIWHPGACVFAGVDTSDGSTVSIPGAAVVAGLAGAWRASVDYVFRGLVACKAPADTLGAAGLSLVDFLIDSDPDSSGISIDSVTPEGAPAALLAACRKEYMLSKRNNSRR